MLERTGCLGACPRYRVTLSADGAVQFDGIANVEVTGSTSGRIEAAAFADLWRELSAAPFEALQRVECASLDTDQPSARVVVFGDGVERRVDDYRGCNGNATLDEFRVLADRIDAIANTDVWIRGDAT